MAHARTFVFQGSVGTRPAAAEPPSVWLGFREDIAPEDFRRWVDSQDTAAMYSALRRLDVAKDDVIFVPAGLPHALGTGLFVLEPQEPTDFSITVEYKRYNLDPAKMTFGLGWDTALSCIDYNGYTEEDLLDRVRCVPQPILAEAGGSAWNIIRPESKPFFSAQRFFVTKRLQSPPPRICGRPDCCGPGPAGRCVWRIAGYARSGAVSARRPRGLLLRAVGRRPLGSFALPAPNGRRRPLR